MKKVDIKTLVPNEENPRLIKEHAFKKLVNSVQEFPEMLEYRPIIVDDENVILAGNMRYRACMEAGLKKVPVIVAKDLSQEQKDQLIIKDNQNYGEWDWDMLADNWKQEKLVAWGFEPYNFGTPTSFLDMEEETEPLDDLPSIEKPKITDDGYVRYEIVMLEEDKQFLVETLAAVRKEHEVTLAEALMIVIKQYKS